MIKSSLKSLVSILSNSALETVYERRRQKIHDRNYRTIAAVLLVGGMLIGLMAFIGGMFFIERDARSYLASRNRVQILDSSDVRWEFGEVDACTANSRDCVPFHPASIIQTQVKSLQQLSEMSFSAKTPKWILLRAKVPYKNWSELSEFLTLVVSLPNVRYYKADAYLNNQKQRSFFLSRPINFVFETSTARNRELDVAIIFESNHNDVFSMGREQPLFVSTQSEFEKYGEYLTLQRSGRGNWVAIVSRITLALFSIGLFLLIDSSPESLGLALFMGAEALGIASRQGWLPLSWLGPMWDLFAASFFTNVGLVFKLYFYINLSRIGGSSLNRWLSVALLWSLPMAYYAMHSANKPSSLYNSVYAAGVLTVTLIGVAACVRSFVFIRRQDLPWRKMALASAAVAGVAPILLSLDVIVPVVITDPNVVDTLNAIHFNSGFLLALSAFFNISSLENRVRALSVVQLKAKQLEMELELARAVQKQHMHAPSLPDDISVECFQSPASYVSGDTYFFNWDGRRKIFTFLLNDVTGHGVQAALKATICNVMADMMFAQAQERPRRIAEDFPLVTYNRLICKYLNDRFKVEDLHSICGGQFFAETGQLLLYRSNSPSPMIIQPSSGEGFDADRCEVVPLALRNGTVTSYQLKPGSVVMLMSDGIMFSSRELSNITRRLTDLTSQVSANDVSLGVIKDLVTKLAENSGRDVDDDKTVLMFKWQPKPGKAKITKFAG